MKARNHAVAPAVKKSARSLTGEIITHPAFGMIEVNSVTCTPSVSLYGSDLEHSSYISFRISRSESEVNGAREYHSSQELLLEFKLSYAQFAKMITSSGNSGTPCTLTYTKTGLLEEMPEIEKIETKQDALRDNIQRSVQEQLDHLKEEVAKMGEMIESGKVGKKELREIHRQMNISIQNMPSNLAYAVEEAERALESATVAAKMEVEAFIDARAKALGLQNIEQKKLTEI